MLDAIVKKQKKEIDFSKSFEVILQNDYFKHVIKKFEAFCIPSPGRRQLKKFEGDLKTLDEEFVEYFQKLLKSVVDELPTKKSLLGDELKISDVASYFSSYAAVFKEGQMPTTKSLILVRCFVFLNTKIELL